jgi:hypothetical protein
MVYVGDVDLYVGEAAHAYDHFMLNMRQLEKSFLLRAAHVRAPTFLTRAKLAIASIEARPALRAIRIAEARWIAVDPARHQASAPVRGKNCPTSDFVQQPRYLRCPHI